MKATKVEQAGLTTAQREVLRVLAGAGEHKLSAAEIAETAALGTDQVESIVEDLEAERLVRYAGHRAEPWAETQHTRKSVKVYEIAPRGREALG